MVYKTSQILKSYVAKKLHNLISQKLHTITLKIWRKTSFHRRFTQSRRRFTQSWRRFTQSWRRLSQSYRRFSQSYRRFAQSYRRFTQFNRIFTQAHRRFIQKIRSWFTAAHIRHSSRHTSLYYPGAKCRIHAVRRSNQV